MSKGKANLTLPGASRKEFAERLQALLMERGTTLRLAEKIGASSSAVRQWKSGKTEPSRDYLIATSEALNISLTWLCIGEIITERDCEVQIEIDENELPKLRKREANAKDVKELQLIKDEILHLQKYLAASNEHLVALKRLSKRPSTVNALTRRAENDWKSGIGRNIQQETDGFNSEFTPIPRYDAHLAAGNGAFNDRAQLIDHIPFTNDFLTKKIGRSSSEGLVILEVRGDSMEPTIGDGDLVMVDQTMRGIEDGIMAFVLDDTAYVKRLRYFFDGVDIISDNRDLYSTQQLDKSRMDELQIIGRVRWCGRLFGR